MSPNAITHQTLQQIPLLADLPTQLAEHLLATSRTREMERSAVLFQQGDPALTVYGILAGRLRLTQHTLDGTDVTLSVFTVGETVGLGAVISGDEYPGTCEVSDDAVVLAIPRSSFLELMASHGPLANRVINMLVHRLHEAHDHIRELSSERVERRVARTLLRLANKVGLKTEFGIKIDMPLSRQDLAEMCGTTLHTVSRILSEWQRLGLVDIGREQVTVTRAHDLVLIAEEQTRRGKEVG
jgi:CRP/FNR family transcriptional regulator, nitrogen oxide reductase regulator